jgi:hypothetical protein
VSRLSAAAELRDGEDVSLQEFLDEMEGRIDLLARKGAFDGKKIVLFGASVNEGRCKRWLEERGFAVDAIIDNSREKAGREYLGVLVQTPEEVLLPVDKDRVVLIASTTYWSEMTQQVVQMGYSKRAQVFTVGVDSKKTRLLFLRRLIETAKGGRALRKLAHGPDGKRTVFVAPQSSAGDVYVECLFIREFMRRHNLQRPVIAVPNVACRRMAELFGFEDVVVLEEHVLWKIADYVRFTRRGPQDMVPMYYLMLNGGVALLQGYKGLNFEKMFRYVSFDLDDDVRHDVPMSGSDPEAARAALVSNGLRPGRTVILAPYARTLVHGHHEQFWGGLAAELTARGFDVCTSGFGPHEPAVAGTPLVQFSFSEAVQFVESAGFFVGLRSGQCDAISSAKAVKVILHERGPWFKTSLFGMFSLNAMGLCDDAIEFEFSSSEMDAILDDVLAVLP